MKLSPDGAYVLTNAMDNTLRIWVSANICTRDDILLVT